MKVTILLVILLSNIILTSNSEVECNGTTTEHCSKCSTGDDSDSCSSCDDKHFLFFNNLFCVPCNDSTYGQIGCEGNCDGSDYVDTRFAFCEKGGCAEGYYNLNGICMNCSVGSPACKKCTYEVQENETHGNFICEECENNEYRINSFGLCQHCYLSGCEKCHYENNTEAVCDKCMEGYFKDSYMGCSSCYYNYPSGKRCYVCSENETDYEFCNCYSGYTKVGKFDCLSCSYGCEECSYDNKTNTTECSKCYSGYILDSDKNCISCGERCQTCELDKYKNPICLSCYSSGFLDNGKCLVCDWGCSNCTIDPKSEYKNDTLYTSCDYNYAFNPDTNNCTYCSDIPEIGEYSCKSCIYNEKFVKYECLECWDDDYVYVRNTFQCFPNYDPSLLHRIQ